MAASRLKILGIAGSLRKDSYNLWALKNAAKLLPSSATMTIHDISGLPVFNQDFENQPTEAVCTMSSASSFPLNATFVLT
jgi:chromate reductase